MIIIKHCMCHQSSSILSLRTVVCKPEKSDETEVFYTVKMSSQEEREGNVLGRNKWTTMLGLIHYVLVNGYFSTKELLLRANKSNLRFKWYFKNTVT
jgi:hypothetical protein